MQRNHLFLLLAFLLPTLGTGLAAQPAKETLIAKPGAFQTLLHPNCSHCLVEANRRKQELRADDRVLCWRQVFCDGYTNDGAIPLRFFLNTYRVLSDNWGVFIYDPDAGYARISSGGGVQFLWLAQRRLGHEGRGRHPVLVPDGEGFSRPPDR